MRHLIVTLSVLFVVAGCSKVGPPRTFTIKADDGLVERGRYLGEHVTACVECHSTRDWSRLGGPAVVDTEGKGGERYGAEMGFPGTFYAPNITPHALSSWTDGEVERALVSGVSRDGRPLFPIMPYRSYGQMCQQDVDAVIAWLRTLNPQVNDVPAPSWSFPFGLILNGIPKEQPRGACGDPADVVGYGKYVATMAACAACHTRTERGAAVAGMDWAGGLTMKLEHGTVTAANITPDAETGIGSWTKEAFVARFRAGAEPPVVGQGGAQSIMPWASYAGMTDQDLEALYDFLRTVPAVKNPITTWTPTPAP